MLKTLNIKKSLLTNTRRSLSHSIPKVKNFINGRFEESAATKWFDVINPATQEVVCRVPQSTPEELARAEAGAKKAFETWKEVAPQQRQVTKLVLRFFLFNLSILL